MITFATILLAALLNEPTGCPEFEVEQPKPHGGVTVKAVDFGLSTDRKDNQVAINLAIKEAKRLKADRVELAPGTYYCHGETGLVINGLEDVVVDGRNAVLVFYRRHPNDWDSRKYDPSSKAPEGTCSNVKIENCHRVRVENLVTDWDWQVSPLGFFGKVIGKHLDEADNASYVDFELPETERHPFYPNPVPVQLILPMNDERTNARLNGDGFRCYCGMSPGHFGCKNEWLAPNRIRIWVYVKQPDRPQFANAEARFTPAANRRICGGFDEGGMYSITHHYYGMGGVSLVSNRHLTLRNYRIWSARGGGMGITGDAKYTWLDGFRLAPPTVEEAAAAGLGNARLRNVTATCDGLHMSRSHGYTKLTDCEFALHHDDSVNFHDCTQIARKTGTRTLRYIGNAANDYAGIVVGSNVTLHQEDYSDPHWSGKVVAFDAASRVLTFDRDLPEQTGFFFVLFNDDYCTSNLLFRNCTFHRAPWARNLILASNVTFDGCTFEDLIGSPLRFQLCYTYNVWSEGAGSTNILVKGCTFRNCADVYTVGGVSSQIYCGVRVPGYNYWPERGVIDIKDPELKAEIDRRLKVGPSAFPTAHTEGVLSGIAVVGNTFINPRGYLWYAMNGSDFVMRDNRVVFDGKAPYRLLPEAGRVRCDEGEIRCVPQPAATAVLLPEQLDMNNQNVAIMHPIDEADWVWSPGDAKVRLFRRRFTSATETVRIHVSADNRYVLRLDGKRIARGPERGTVLRWTFRTLDLNLTEGEHMLEAVVDRVGAGHHANDAADKTGELFGSPLAQLEWWKTGGFILRAEGRHDADLTTGKAPWLVYSFDNLKMAGERGGSFGCGGSNVITGSSPWFAKVEDAAMTPVQVVRHRVAKNIYGCGREGWRLYPTALPPQLDEVKTPGTFKAVSTDIGHQYVYRQEDADPARLAAYEPMLRGETVTIPPRTTANILWDLGNYYCAYPEVEVSGGKGARLEFGWSESLIGAKDGLKRDRDVFAGKKIICFNDVFLPDGGDDGFTTTWWRAGRWVRLLVKTADEPLVVKRLSIAEVHYPTPYTAKFECSDKTIAPILTIAERTMQMCTHEMSFDCPYYEQQMYPGDTRLQLLTHHVLSADDRLVRRDIELFDFSRREDGRVGFNFPTIGTQDGGSYTFMWPMMLADYARWRDNAAWLRRRFPGLVHTMEGFHNFETEEGLVVNMPGWNFQDWAEWPAGGVTGCDPAADTINSFNSLFYLGMLESAAYVADVLGEKEFAAAYRRRAARTRVAILKHFWDEKRGLVAGDCAHTFYSEHSQAMAILFDALPAEKAARCAEGLLTAKDLVRCTVYFSHYLFDAYAKIGRADVFLKKLDLWRGYVAKHLKTVQEAPDKGMPDQPTSESRSDCHAWSAHPIYHLHADVLGLQPSRPFFGAVRIAPQPGELTFIRATTPSPRGDIVSDLKFNAGKVSGRITLPATLSGEFVWKDQTVALRPGANDISL